MRPKLPPRSQTPDVSVVNWQMIYCSFALILVVFFAMMVSYSILSGKGMRAVRRHFVQGSSLHAPGSSMNPLSGIPFEESGDAAVLIQNATTRFGLGNTVRVSMGREGIDIFMKDRVLFAAGAVNVDKGLHPYLNVIADAAARNGLQIQVRVHVSESGAGMGGDPSPWMLSSLRAVNIMRYFLAYDRLAADQVSAAGSVVMPGSGSAPDAEEGIALHLSVGG